MTPSINSTNSNSTNLKPSEQKRVQGFTRELGRILRTITENVGAPKPEKKPVEKPTKKEKTVNDQ